ncbi:MAG: aminoacyl-tRNA hydrolase [Candidatus Sungbacteria bacterium RIFCSPLOWO2_01_FULL_47_10]|uniref:Peptidyl-tRNA hydrolase n=1 Tax=Candidatus Sungbacteria bacterium RIFCSPLOWO2_01_FULL_47_10 TaxID=1802276 RepID=A0A1G2L7K9_9BACT|nr:MAG: aminoacyl-tRNA hydrolase [Candidatus Sungbacteria bacterium RIFCSPLOWO2_01_FULL_47_10]
MMYLFVGLGNPGQQYEKTRHNIGREMLALWFKKAPQFNGAGLTYEKKWNALFAKHKKAVLLLPETFMNNSGKATGPATKFFKIKPAHIIVLHDDSDIELGRTKLSFAKHSAGHKGVESIKRALGTWDFWRLRIGIQRKKRVDAMKLVLQKFRPDEERAVKKISKKISEGLDLILEEGPEKAMNFINQN